MDQPKFNCFAATNSQIYLPAIQMAIETNGGKLVGVEPEPNKTSLDREIKKTKAEVLILTLKSSKLQNALPAHYKLIEQIQKAYPSIKIIAIAEEPEEILGLTKTEVKGFLLVNEHFDELIKAIKMVSRGENYYSPKIMQIIVKKSYNEYSSLTDRETEVLLTLTKEKKRGPVAKKLGISDSTLRVHIRNIRTKLGTNVTI